MTGESTTSRNGDESFEQRQVTPGEELSSSDTDRCEAIADSTGERCKRSAIQGIPYCGLHKRLVDEIDIDRMGLKWRNSDV